MFRLLIFFILIPLYHTFRSNIGLLGCYLPINVKCDIPELGAGPFRFALAVDATLTLLEILEVDGPTRTSELREWLERKGPALSSRTVCRLLRDSGQAKMEYGGQGMYTYGIWKLAGERGNDAPTPTAHP